jgi:hypothetical protein
VEAYRHTWKPLVRKGGADVVVRILADTAQDVIREHLRHRFADLSAGRTEPATQFLTAGLMGLLTWWLDSEDPATATEVHAMYGQLARPGLRRFLAPT